MGSGISHFFRPSTYYQNTRRIRYGRKTLKKTPALNGTNPNVTSRSVRYGRSTQKWSTTSRSIQSKKKRRSGKVATNRVIRTGTNPNGLQVPQENPNNVDTWTIRRPNGSRHPTAGAYGLDNAQIPEGNEEGENEEGENE